MAKSEATRSLRTLEMDMHNGLARPKRVTSFSLLTSMAKCVSVPLIRIA